MPMSPVLWVRDVTVVSWFDMYVSAYLKVLLYPTHPHIAVQKPQIALHTAALIHYDFLKTHHVSPPGLAVTLGF